MKLRRVLASGAALGLCVSAAALAAAAPASATDGADKVGLKVDLPAVIGAGGDPAPFTVTVSNPEGARGDSALSLALSRTGGLDPDEIVVTYAGRTLALERKDGKVVADVPAGDVLAKVGKGGDLPFTLGYEPKTPVGTSGKAAPVVDAAVAGSGGGVRATTFGKGLPPVRDCATPDFGKLTVDATLALREVRVQTTDDRDLTASDTARLGLPALTLSGLPAKVAAGAAPVEFSAVLANRTASAYPAYRPWFGLAGTGLRADDVVLERREGGVWKRVTLRSAPGALVAPLTATPAELAAGARKTLPLRLSFGAGVPQTDVRAVALTLTRTKRTVSDTACHELRVEAGTPARGERPAPVTGRTAQPVLAETGAGAQAAYAGAGALCILAGLGILLHRRRGAVQG